MDTEAVFKAKQALNKFLQQHPKYIAMQKEIDRKLDGMVTQENRLTYIEMLMRDSLKELGSEWNKLISELAIVVNKK